MAFIYNLSDTWNDAATTWNGIKLAVTNTGADASSKLLNLTVTGSSTASFVVDKSGNLALNGSINKITFTTPATAATFTLADNSTFTTVGGYATTFTFSGATSLTFPTSGTVTALGNTTTGTGSIVLANGPTITLANATGLPITGVTGLGSGVETFLVTPSSANLRSAVTDETGSGLLVFGTSPTIGSPTFTGTATFNGSTSGSVAVKAAASAGSTTFQLPVGNGTSGYVLVTDGLGNTSWAASGGAVGSAAGVDKNVQFNDSGNMAGNAAFNFDKSTYTLSVGTASTTSGKFALYNSASANAVTVASGNNSVAWTMTLPTTAGTNGYAMVTDGSGNMSWSAIAAGTINTGSAGQITYYSGTNALSGTTTGTGVLTALGVNTGTAGAFVVNGGALGTPSSGNLSSCTNIPVNQATGTLAVANGGTGLTSGTSGGVLYYSATGTLASSAALAANSLVIGGGAGVAPSTTTTGTGIITFLGTPSSANLASAVTDETGSGSLVFGTSPTLTTPRIAGSSTGYTSLASANSSATNYTVTFPAETMTVGFRNIPAVGTKTGSYTLAVGDIGKYVQVGTGGSITIPDATFAEGDVVSVFNNTTGAITITCTITTAYIAGTDTDKASVSLATRGLATILFISGTVCVISGNVT